MAFRGKIALFVEGSLPPRHTPGKAPLELIWLRHLVNHLHLLPIDRLIPISKKAITLLDPTLGTISGVGAIPLDVRLATEYKRRPFDAAVVAWDLHPPWDTTARPCRRQEVIGLYAGLAESDALPPEWKRWSDARCRDINDSATGKFPPLRLEQYAVIPVCMEPMFESILIQCEKTILASLGLSRTGGTEWPRWKTDHPNPSDLIAQALGVAARVRPKPAVFRQIRGDFHTAKNEWGEYFIRAILADDKCKQVISQHPLPHRLSRILRRS